MAGTTDKRHYPFPGQLDVFNGPQQIQDALAAVDADMDKVKAVADKAAADLDLQLGGMRIIANRFNAAAGPSNSYTRTITFGVTFSSPPIVVPFLMTTQGGSRTVDLRTSQVTTTNFVCWVYTVDSSTMKRGDSFPSAYIAIGAA